MMPNKFLLEKSGTKVKFDVESGSFATIVNNNKFIGELFVSNNGDLLDSYDFRDDTPIRYREDLLVGSDVWLYHLNPQQIGRVYIGYYISETTLDEVSKEQVGLGNVPNLDTTDAVNNSHTHANKLVLDATTASFTVLAENTLTRLNDIKDNLTSNDTDKAGSANQLRVLKGFIDSINSLLLSDDATLDDLQEIVDFIKQNKDDLDALTINNIAGLPSALSDRELIINKTTSISAVASDVLYPTEKAVRTELDSKSGTAHTHTANDVSETATKKWMSQVERTKFNGIEDGATADMTASEIKTSYESNADTNAFTDAEKTALPNKVDKVSSTDKHLTIFDGANGQIQDSSSRIVNDGLYLGGGLYTKDDKIVMHPDGKYLRASFNVAGHYGYTEYRNSDNERGLYMGYGDGDTNSDIYLDKATVLNLKGGDLKMYSVGSGLVQPEDASKGKVYTSDAGGKGSWKTPMKLDQSVERGTLTRVLEHFQGAAAHDYIHIRTPLNKSTSRMFHFQVTGYAYGDSKIIDIVYVGYMYATSGTLANRQSHDRIGTFVDVDSYIGSDDYLYLRIKFTNDYYVSFVVDSLVVGNGVVFPPEGFSVIRSDNLTE